MPFDPNQLLNSTVNLMAIKGQGVKTTSLPPATAEPITPAPMTPAAEASQGESAVMGPFDPTFYQNAFSRLGLLQIANVCDLGCGEGRFTSVMAERRQRREVYMGVDISHGRIKVAKDNFPGWNFIYGDFFSPQVRQQYERYEAFLLLNVLETLDNDLEFLVTVPSGKPMLFNCPLAPAEGLKRHFEDMGAIRERYSNYLSIKSIGRANLKNGDRHFMVVGTKW
ncbi:MAG: class I SAM-dependent methyltransferase [Deltaproteobacteria bacterium]|nr:class I SAM-dependent methyltransferase [Deltaproteobacteria bacterium]